MVYRGKLSPFCEPCRASRRKCDLDPQGCSQCARQGIVCSGYRKVIGLRFLDQSAETAHRLDGQKGNAQRLSIRKSFPATRTILPSLEDQACCYFFTNYVPDSHFFYLPGIYTRSKLAGPLIKCVQAAAVASFANERSSSTVMGKALKYYSYALRDVKAAIESPTAAGLDDLIVAVLLLGLFEALVYQNKPAQRDEADSSTHNHGALAILEMRGPEVLQQELGFHIFVQISSSIRVSCLQHQQRAPARLINFHKRSIPFLDPENPKVRFFPIIDEFINLQADIVENNLQHSLEAVVEAMRIDMKCKHLMATIHSSQNYEFDVCDSEDEWAYGNKYHQYPDGNIAQWWNSMRMTRIFLNKIIMQQMPPPEELDSILETKRGDRFAASVAVITSMSAEICASVYQFVHEVEASKAQRRMSQSNTAVMGLLSRLFWPLCTVGETEILPNSMKSFAARCLRYLGTEAGFPQAVAAASMIEEKNLDVSWAHLYHV
ncbi:hypothetical protein BX600DRAFT_155792 [Xylariales sp. PMI_506]|nr:hypothetical protein BX600DRAFT_155792 [Xylariales sp. PMI_506]